MTRCLIVAFHKYTPFGSQYYEPILDFQIQTLKKYEDEYDRIYFIDSNWNIDLDKLEKADIKGEIIRVNPSLRYYQAYQEVLPTVTEDLVFFLDNDSIIWK